MTGSPKEPLESLAYASPSCETEKARGWLTATGAEKCLQVSVRTSQWYETPPLAVKLTEECCLEVLKRGLTCLNKFLLEESEESGRMKKPSEQPKKEHCPHEDSCMRRGSAGASKVPREELTKFQGGQNQFTTAAVKQDLPNSTLLLSLLGPAQ